MVPSPWERRSFIRGMRQGGAVARDISSGNQWAKAARPARPAPHPPWACTVSVRVGSLEETHTCLRWEDSWEANRSTWASPNWLQISRIVSGWSRHSPGNVSCRESASAARLSFPEMWTACSDLNCVWLQRRRWRPSCDMRCDHILPNRLIRNSRSVYLI